MNSEYRPEPDRDEGIYSGYYGTGTPHKSRRSGISAFLIIALLLAVGVGVFAQRYRIDLQRGDGLFSLSVVDRDAAEPPADVQPEPPSVQEPAAPPAAKTGTGATLEISASPAVIPIANAEGELTLQEIYKKMIPSVASIITVMPGGTSTGTGIVMTEDGYIITNCHVIDNAAAVTVLLSDDSEYEASLVGADAISDIAVLKIDAQNLTAAEFGNSDTVQVGDSVVAIGDPLGIELRGTMTDGIISAINRDITTEGRRLTLLQTNAQLNSGNSGGPLINSAGQVIGINTMKMGNYYSSSAEGLGFAIPIGIAKPIIDELIAQGFVAGRPAIGIQGSSVPSYARAYYRLPNGIYIDYVVPDSDAAAQGISAGDIVTAIDGTPVSTLDELNVVKNTHTAGDTVTLTVYRHGTYYEVPVVLMDQNDAD
ncbi:MAG: trypsin-like peptidase domain-containing protein [Oscillospiraceae bacterium]|nr:trypsin-like peptidase domain-containing protein [Oscillospiraceae bacterium]